MPRTTTNSSLLAASLVAILVIAAAVSERGIAAEPDRESALRRHRTFNIGNRDSPDEIQLLAISKSFCVAMRRDDGSKERRLNLSDYISPAYLKKHNLKQSNLPIETLPVNSIFNIQLADDGQTLLCIVNTKGSDDKHAIVLRTVVIDGNLYIDPVSAPDAKSDKFTPWTLRMKV